MYQTKFYGQSGYNRLLYPKPYTDLAWSSPESTSFIMTSDKGHDDLSLRSCSGFEQRLKVKINELRQQEVQLKEEIASLKGKTPDQPQKKHILTSLSFLESSKKLLALIVEQMQKCMQIISSNFH